jgi:hypothetical protein
VSKKLSEEAVIEVARAIEAAHFPVAEVPAVEGEPLEPAPPKEPAGAYVAEARSFVAAFNAAVDVMERPEPMPDPGS